MAARDSSKATRRVERYRMVDLSFLLYPRSFTCAPVRSIRTRLFRDFRGTSTSERRVFLDRSVGGFEGDQRFPRSKDCETCQTPPAALGQLSGQRSLHAG